MAMFDDQWFTGVQTALTGIATAVLGVLSGWGLARRRVSSDNTAIVGEQSFQAYLRSLVEDRDKDKAEAAELGRLEARAAALKERIEDMEKGRERMIGSCEERVRSLAEQVLDLKMANGRLFAELARCDKDAAERLLVEHLRPVQPSKGDEPP